MDPIKEYLLQRRPIEKAGLVAALDHLATTGNAIDVALTSAERARALCDEGEGGRFEQIVQTLGGLSREIWTSHSATLKAILALAQLERAERGLSG